MSDNQDPWVGTVWEDRSPQWGIPSGDHKGNAESDWLNWRHQTNRDEDLAKLLKQQRASQSHGIPSLFSVVVTMLLFGYSYFWLKSQLALSFPFYPLPPADLSGAVQAWFHRGIYYAVMGLLGMGGVRIVANFVHGKGLGWVIGGTLRWSPLIVSVAGAVALFRVLQLALSF